MLIVGLTGGIASGKSTVSKEIARQGILVLDCDAIAHDVTCRGRWGYRRVLRAFGPSVLTSSGGHSGVGRAGHRVKHLLGPASRLRTAAGTHQAS
jgi:dephospho-CoA kinase